MRSILVATLALASGLFCAAIASPQPLRVLIVTGGHDFEEADFLGMFHQMDGITFTHVIYGQGAEEALTPVGMKDFDTIVFYDMHQEKDPQSKGIEYLLAQGKGMVFLHHSLWSYDGTWPEYYQILGGRASSKERVVPGDLRRPPTNTDNTSEFTLLMRPVPSRKIFAISISRMKPITTTGWIRACTCC